MIESLARVRWRKVDRRWMHDLEYNELVIVVWKMNDLTNSYQHDSIRPLRMIMEKYQISDNWFYKNCVDLFLNRDTQNRYLCQWTVRYRIQASISLRLYFFLSLSLYYSPLSFSLPRPLSSFCSTILFLIYDWHFRSSFFFSFMLVALFSFGTSVPVTVCPAFSVDFRFKGKG